MDAAIENSAMRKIYLRLLPFAVLSYILAYIDRINVSFAVLQMRGQLGLTERAVGRAGGIFFIGYFLFQLPSNLVLERFGVRRWISRERRARGRRSPAAGRDGDNRSRAQRQDLGHRRPIHGDEGAARGLLPHRSA